MTEDLVSHEGSAALYCRCSDGWGDVWYGYLPDDHADLGETIDLYNKDESVTAFRLVVRHLGNEVFRREWSKPTGWCVVEA
jgi:hypothetical protein